MSVNNCYRAGMYTFIIFTTVIIPLAVYGNDNYYIDYDLPLISELDEYAKYHFRPATRYTRSKLEAKEFFFSVYNQFTRALLPAAKMSKIDYKLYKELFDDMKVDQSHLEKVKSNLEEAIAKEKIPDRSDPRYVFPSPFHDVATDKKYYESMIYEIQLDVVDNYIHNNTQQPLDIHQYNYVMINFIMAPKCYENNGEFISARFSVAWFFKSYIPNWNCSVKHLNDLDFYSPTPRLSFLDVVENSDSYINYVLRSIRLGKIPLHHELCNKFYKTNYDDAHLIKLISSLTIEGIEDLNSNEPCSDFENNDSRNPHSITGKKRNLRSQKPSSSMSITNLNEVDSITTDSLSGELAKNDEKQITT